MPSTRRAYDAGRVAGLLEAALLASPVPSPAPIDRRHHEQRQLPVAEVREIALPDWLADLCVGGPPTPGLASAAAEGWAPASDGGRRLTVLVRRSGRGYVVREPLPQELAEWRAYQDARTAAEDARAEKMGRGPLSRG